LSLQYSDSSDSIRSVKIHVPKTPKSLLMQDQV